MPREELAVGESEQLHERQERKPTKFLSVGQEPNPLLHLTRERSASVHCAGTGVEDDVVNTPGLAALNHAVKRPLDEDAGRDGDVCALTGTVARQALDRPGPEPRVGEAPALREGLPFVRLGCRVLYAMRRYALCKRDQFADSGGVGIEVGRELRRGTHGDGTDCTAHHGRRSEDFVGWQRLTRPRVDEIPYERLGQEAEPNVLN